MEPTSYFAAILGHSFVARAQRPIEELLDNNQIVGRFQVAGKGGMQFGCEKYKAALQTLARKTERTDLPVVVIVFLGDNDIFKKDSDSFGPNTRNLTEAALEWYQELLNIRSTLNAERVYLIGPAVRRGRPNHNRTLEVIDYLVRRLTHRRRWVTYVSREERGGWNPDELSPDNIHPREEFFRTWILDFITLALEHMSA